jgi:hypothetical protein
LKAEVDEISINENTVGWNQGCVVAEEKRRSNWCSERMSGWLKEIGLVGRTRDESPSPSPPAPSSASIGFPYYQEG